MNDKIQFRAWDEKQKYMAYQGDPDLETLQSFIHHFGDKELMQWTGLCDCNGKKIYENDVVLVSGQGHFLVEDVKRDFDFLVNAVVEKDMQAIAGNVKENPELLEKFLF